MKLSYHPISLMLFPLRCGGYWVMSVSAWILYTHGLVSGWVSLYAIFTALIWGPAVLYLCGRMTPANGKRADLMTLNYLDPLLTGIWLILANGSPWYLLFAMLGLGSGICSVLGFAAWLRGLSIILALGLFSFWWHGFQLLFNTPTELEVFALLACTVYTLMIGRNQYTVATRIEATKTELEASVKELHQINQFMQVTIGSKTMSSLIQNINRLMRDFFGFKSTDLCLLDELNQELFSYNIDKYERKTSFHWSVNEDDKNKSMILTVFSTGKTLVVNNLKDHEKKYTVDEDYLRMNSSESIFVMPLKYMDKTLGCLCIFSDKPIDESEEFSKKLMNYLNNVAIIISNHQIFKDFTRAQIELHEKNMSLENESVKLSRYLSPQIYEWIFSSKNQINISSNRKRITFMMVSMQNFYQVLDQLDSDKISLFVNNYLTCMSELILKYGGTIDQYLGVQIRVFFGDPLSLGVKNDALNSLQLALSMQEAFHQFKQAWPADLVAHLGLRTAISSGYTDVGNFGSEYRMNYTVMGSIVNVVTHLLAQAQTEQILITEDTRLLTKAYAKVTPLEPLRLNPKSKAILVYQLNALLPIPITVAE